MWTFNDSVTDTELETAFGWYFKIAKFLKTNDPWGKDDLQGFIKELRSNVLYAGYIDREFMGLIQGEHKTNETVEGHLFCGSDDLDFLTMLITYAKNQALKKYKFVLTQTPTRHTTMLGLNLRAGFFDTGLRSWSSVYKGRLLTIQHNVAVR